MLADDRRARGHAPERETDSHYAYRQPAAPAGADPLYARRARGEPVDAAELAGGGQGRDACDRGEAGRGRHRRRQQRRAAARLLPLLHTRPAERARRLVAAAQRADVERYPIFKKESYQAKQQQGIGRRHSRPAEGDRRDRLSGCQRRQGRMRGLQRGAGGEPAIRSSRRSSPHPRPAWCRRSCSTSTTRARKNFSARSARPCASNTRPSSTRVPAAARLPGSRAREAQHLPGPAARRLHRLRQPRDRRDQSCDPRHPARARAPARVLGQLRRPARSRRRAGRDHPGHAARQGRRLRAAVRQPAARA